MDIASLLEVQVNEEPLSEGLPGESKDEPKVLRASEFVSPEEKHFRKLLFGQDLAKVRFRRLHCTSCDTHIGSAPAEAYNMQEHPILKVLLCAACREFYGDGTFEQGDDATDMFCRWCANGGNLYCCSYCSNTFCQKCIRINFDADVRKQIEADEKWKCFVCYPAPLYSHRAVCWALLQHVKTLSRILTADRVMTPKEILAKMELDDAQCCPGRKAKRKRKASVSSSDNESVTSKTSRTSSRTRKRSIKRRRATSGDSNDTPNGTRYIPIAPKKSDDDDITHLLNPEQTMVEGDGETLILPGNPRIPSLKPISTSALVRSPLTRGPRVIPIRPLRRIESLPPGATPQLITRLPGFRTAAPMVTIPTRPVLMSTTPGASGGIRRSFPILRADKNDSKQQTKAPPSVIDLESDSDDNFIGESSSVQNYQDNLSNQIDQTGQIKDKNQTSKSEESEGASGHLETPDVTYPRLTVRRFDQTISNPMKAVDEILKKLRKRLRHEMSSFNSSEGNDVNSAKTKLKIINRNISKIVSELAVFNNTMVRQYKPWKTSCMTGKPVEDSTGKIRLRKGEASYKIIPLDMECERESESEDDEEEVEEHNSIDFSNKIVEFNEKMTVDRGCSARVSTKNKAIQVYDEMSIDYDRTVGYSLLMKADFDNDEGKEVQKPVIIEDHFAGQYEEQFIFYLQRLEEEDEEMENTSPKTLREMIDDDLAAQEKRETRDCALEGEENDKENPEEVEVVVEVEEVEELEEMEVGEDGDQEKGSDGAGEVDEGLEKTERAAESSEEGNANDVEEIRGEITESGCEEEIQGDKEGDNEGNDGETVAMEEDGDISSGDKDSEVDQDKEKISSSQEARNEETVIAVRALIEDETRDGTLKKNWTDGDDDECTVLE
uniref:ATRX_1 protein n=1 Tax=Fopius arisanus TaxID=64838 RepID=A0A0C9RMJ5_9HYME